MTRASKWRGTLPPLIPALKPVLLDSYAPYPNSRTRPQPPARLSAEGWRVAMGSSQIWRKSDIELLFFECSSIDRKDRGKCEKMVEFKLRLRLKNDFDRKNELPSYDNYENSKIHSIPLSTIPLLFTRRVEIRIHYVKVSFPFFPRYSSRSPIVFSSYAWSHRWWAGSRERAWMGEGGFAVRRIQWNLRTLFTRIISRALETT